VCLFATEVGAQSSRQNDPKQTLVIEHVTVLPMVRDTALVDHTVMTSQDRITWIGPSRNAPVPQGAQRVDGRGAYLIPGLADMHVHLETVDEFPLYVASGVTTVRNMNGTPQHLRWREQVAKGQLEGPRIFTAGPAIQPRRFGFFGGYGPRTLDEADAFAREQSRAGYDMIKVQTGITLPVYRRLVATARTVGIPVVGHVAEGVGSANALAAGQVTFEHANIYMFGGDERRLDEGARAIARAGTWVGTLISGERCSPTELQRRIIGALRRAGVRLLAGTDASIPPMRPGTALHCELATLVAAGLTPYEALVAATRDAGEFARLHLKEQVPFGIVAVGARADLVLLPSDPRADIGSVGRSLGTVLHGVWRPRPR
jgi:imidazolonepropionase-like amidohydrolase